MTTMIEISEEHAKTALRELRASPLEDTEAAEQALEDALAIQRPQ